MSRRKKRFKVRYVVLGVLAVLVIAAAVVIGTHWDLIRAAKMGLTMDQDAILVDQEEKDREIEESLGIGGMITDEMIAQAQAEVEATFSDSGDPADTTAPTEPGEGAQLSSETGQTGAGQPAPSGETSAGQTQRTASDIVADYTARLYGVRGAFEGRLNGLVASAKAEYLALPPEQQTSSGKSSILTSKLAEAEAMEAECDATVESLLGQMEAELTAAGESTAPVGQLRSYYQEAKVNQKAYYLSQLRGQ